MPGSEASMRGLPPALLLRYEVGEPIGVGGRSTVFAARDALLDRDVAVKVFTAPGAEQGELQAQRAEARLLASLNHRALTTLFDAGLDVSDPERPQLYLVMELVVGCDLRERLRRGPLPTTQVCWLGFDLAEALDHVHAAGFIHHDVKPANVLLADEDGDTRIRGTLTDFGIATIIGEPEDGEFTAGTAAYLSPEQVDGQDATPASDVYSLGLVLLEAATGRRAYPGGVLESAFARLDRQPDVPVTLPPLLGALLREMTARRPMDRPAPRDAAARFQGALMLQRVGQPEPGAAALTDREVARRAALRRYDIRDAPGDDAFDGVVRLAAQLLHVSGAVVSIVDTDRVWFLSRHGVDDDEVERNTSFFVATDPGDGRAWAVPDALEDERLLGDRLVTGEPRVRAYAAAPLITHDGHSLGALCVFDRRPRDFDRQDLQNLTDLAGVVMRELELRLASRRALFQRT